MTPLLWTVSPAVTRRQIAVMAGPPGCETPNSDPAVYCALNVFSACTGPRPVTLASRPCSSADSADGDDTTVTDRVERS